MKKYLRTLSALVLGATMMTSCVNDFLDLDPLDSETEAAYFKSLEEFEYAANYLHTLVYAWSSNTTYSILHDYGTDLVVNSNSAVSGTNTVSTSDTYYSTVYGWLRTTNQLIEKGEEYDDPDEIAGPIGQAYFFRAWHHFFLLQRFGGIPLMLSVTDVDSDVVWGPRSSRYEVIQSVLDDLDVAIEKLAGTTAASTSYDGHVTLEAAQAFKARVCLYEGTWEKYNGRGSDDPTNGDGVTSGAGTTMPDGYPTVTEFLTMAKELSDEIISSDTFELFLGVESAPDSGNPDMYEHTSYFYLFNLEGTDSNPAGVSKADNKEAIYRSVYDHTYRTSGTNLTHTEPAKMSRKLIDMYLCTDGLPPHVSPLFQGYIDENAEFENRDYRLLACHPKAEAYVWGYGFTNSGADYTVDITTLSANTYQYCPNLLTTSSVGTRGRKFCTELATVTYAGEEAMDRMHIRLAEVYLIYAEATCELNGGTISDADLDKSLNIVRARGGVAPLNEELIAYAQTLGCNMNYLGEIRRERAVELYGEGHRVNDACRWGIAEEIFGTPVCGAYVSYDGEDTYLVSMKNPVTDVDVYDASVWSSLIQNTTIEYEEDAYTPTRPGALISETATNRQFAKKNYLQPIPTDEIQLNPELLQNPDW